MRTRWRCYRLIRRSLSAGRPAVARTSTAVRRYIHTRALTNRIGTRRQRKRRRIHHRHRQRSRYRTTAIRTSNRISGRARRYIPYRRRTRRTQAITPMDSRAARTICIQRCAPSRTDRTRRGCGCQRRRSRYIHRKTRRSRTALTRTRNRYRIGRRCSRRYYHRRSRTQTMTPCIRRPHTVAPAIRRQRARLPRTHIIVARYARRQRRMHLPSQCIIIIRTLTTRVARTKTILLNIVRVSPWHTLRRRKSIERL